MAISAKDVMSLRQRTGLGMMQCKKALTETTGDADAAIELLRKTMKGKMDERTNRESAEGVVAVARSDAAIAMIELTCETDFVARNENFIEVTKKIAALALAGGDGDVSSDDEIREMVDDVRISTQENVTFSRGVRLSGSTLGSYVHHNRKIGVVVQVEGELDAPLLTGICQHIAAAVPVPLAVDEASLPVDDVEKHRATAVEEAKASGKPQQIAEKIAVGKLRKWVDEHTLMGQIYLRELDAKKPVRDYVPEGATITRFVRYRLG